MIEIKGENNIAKCFCNTLEMFAEEQIRKVCDQKAFSESKIRIMPDVHAGMGCTIGTTMTIKDKIVPGMVGVDIGCGMETVLLSEKTIDFNRLDEVIRNNIPSGTDIRLTEHSLNKAINLSELRCVKNIKMKRAHRSMGTLGGGNHFIEIDQGEDGNLYLVIHSGSRHLGKEVAEYYQRQGLASFWGGSYKQIEQKIKELKDAGRFTEIQNTIVELSKEHEIEMPKELAYVQGELFDDYIHDMKIVQHFAVLNRKAMTDTLVKGMDITPKEQFTTIHNYIDTEAMILRKGAVSAREGEMLLIPINMRDGSLICEGKGNEDWNFSAPHGAGRLMSRKQARATLTMEQYKTEMKGIYTTCVIPDTLDESPMAYKNIDEIVKQIEPTVKILKSIKPVYNFKAAE